MSYYTGFAALLLCLSVGLTSGCQEKQTLSYEDLGDKAFFEQSYNKAFQYWLKAVEKAPDSAVIYEKIANAQLKLSNLDLAGDYFRKALKIKPAAHDIRKDLIRVDLLRGDLASASRNLDYLKGEEKDSDIYLLLGDMRMMTNNIPQALNMYRIAFNLEPGNLRHRIKLAICMLQSGEQQKAEELLSGIESDLISSAWNLILLSDYYFLERDYDRAEVFLIHAVEQDPNNIMIKIYLCRYYLETGQGKKAEDILSQLETQYPEDLRFKLMLADLYLSDLNLVEAERLLQAAKDKTAYRADYHLLNGKLWLIKGKLPYAVSSLKTAVDENPILISGYYLLGIGYFAGGQTKLAENSFIKALMLNPDHIETLLALAGLHYKNEEYDLSVGYLDRVISLSPLNPRGHRIKGLCLMAQEQYDTASALFYKAWLLDNHLSSLFLMAQAFENSKEFHKAIELYEQILDQRPDSSAVLFKYTSLLLKVGKGQQGLDRINDIFEKGSNNREIYYIAAWLSMKLEHYEPALGTIKKALDGNKTPGPFYLLQSVILEKSGDITGAEKALKQSIEKNPYYTYAWIRLADLYIRYDKKELAFEILKQAYEKFPYHPEISGNLSWLYLNRETELDLALDLARKAYEKLPEKAWLMDTLGWAYYHKQAYSQAKGVLSEAEKKAPEKGVIQFHIGMLFYRQGKLLEAKQKLETALEHELSQEIKDQINKVLADLDENRKQVSLDEESIFDPGQKGLPFAPKLDDEDILKPDWSKMK